MALSFTTDFLLCYGFLALFFLDLIFDINAFLGWLALAMALGRSRGEAAAGIFFCLAWFFFMALPAGGRKSFSLAGSGMAADNYLLALLAALSSFFLVSFRKSRLSFSYQRGRVGLDFGGA